MKRYKDYMDGVEVSDTLHEKLKNLEEPKKKPQPWAKWGAMAAVMALIVGAGTWGLSRGGWDALAENFRPAAGGKPEIADMPAPDIAPVDPDGPFVDPAMPFGGGYEIVEGGLAAYYGLPWLNWADASALPQSALDYGLAPPGAVSRDASLDDVLLFTGGEKAMADHLLWDGLNWDGIFWFLEDGTPCAAGLSARGENLGFYLEVRKGHEVPSCVVLPEDSYEYSTWGGVEITALKGGGYTFTDDGTELNEKREVSFFCDGVGYKLTLYADDTYRADEMCARFVRYAIDNGFHLDALSADGVLDCSYYSVGEPDWEDGGTGEFVPGYDPAYEGGAPDEGSGVEDFYCDCPECIAGTAHTHPYDPNAATEAKAPTPPN